jgi:hypothetical protein
MADDKQGPEISGHWTEVSQDSLIPTVHIGELTISKGRTWQVGRDWGGMNLVVSTDIPYEGGRGRSTKIFLLDGTTLVKALATELLTSHEDDHGQGTATPSA